VGRPVGSRHKGFLSLAVTAEKQPILGQGDPIVANPQPSSRQPSLTPPTGGVAGEALGHWGEISELSAHSGKPVLRFRYALNPSGQGRPVTAGKKAKPPGVIVVLRSTGEVKGPKKGVPEADVDQERPVDRDL